MPQQNTTNDRCVDTDEGATFLGLCAAQLTKLRLHGVIPAVVYGPKCIRFRMSDLIEYRDSLVRGGNGKPAAGRVHPNLTVARGKRKKTDPNKPSLAASYLKGNDFSTNQ